MIIFTAIISLAAIIGKAVGCGVGASLSGQNTWRSAIIGFGMNGRGAVELVVASLIIKLSDQFMAGKLMTEPLLTENQFSALIMMAFITTLIAPLSLKWAVIKACSSDETADFCILWEKSKKIRN